MAAPLASGPAAAVTTGVTTTVAPSASFYNPPAGVISASAAATSTTQVIQYLSSTPKYYMGMYIGTYNRIGAGSLGLLGVNAIDISTSAGLIMPLPEKIVDNYGVTYDQTPLGPFIGGSINSVLKNVHSASDIFGTDNIAGVIGAAGVAGVQSTFGGPGNQVIGGISSAVGYSPNQFLTILFRGPQYKQHQFTWHLSPRNFTEATNLKNILIRLHNAMAPTISTTGLLFAFPNIFQLEFMPNSQYLFKFKPAVLTNIAIDYTSGGKPSFYRAGNDPSGGTVNAPTHVALTLSFLELGFWLSGDWIDDNNPTNVNGNQTVNALTDLSNFIQNLKL